MVVATRCERTNEFYFAVIAAQEALIAECNENDLLLLAVEKVRGF